MDRIKRLSYEVLNEHQSKFGEDFADNKKVLDQISIIRSKGLKNEIAGYITKFIKKQIREEKTKQAQRATMEAETAVQESIPEETVDVTESEEIVMDSEATSEPETPEPVEEKTE
jgi:small subunit ribosomal protein S17e